MYCPHSNGRALTPKRGLPFKREKRRKEQGHQNEVASRGYAGSGCREECETLCIDKFSFLFLVHLVLILLSRKFLSGQR